MHNVFIRVIDFVRRLFGFKEKYNKYGWMPDLPDVRDYTFTAMSTTVPAKVDLRSQDSPIYNQGPLGSCTANAIGGMFQFVNRKTGCTDFNPSRLFVYYGERLIMGTVNQDTGAYLRDGMRVIKNKGVCNETIWPYDISKFKLNPSAAAYADALNHQSIQYQRITRNLTTMKQCLADGYPFVFGFTVYESFETDDVAKTGIVPMPKKNERRLGGHAVMAIGYDDSKKCFIVRNSWGEGWGDKGYFYLPYGFLTSGLSSDFWTLRTVEV